MEKDQKGKEKSQDVIVYIGNDPRLWEDIKRKFIDDYGFGQHEFVKVYRSNAKEYPRLLIEVIALKPQIIYLDFSFNFNECHSLAQFLARENKLLNSPIVGIVDDKKDAKDCLNAGVEFVQVKGGELRDCVFAPIMLVAPKKIKRPNFAVANVESEVDLIDDFRIGYITKKYIHAEGNMFFEEGDIVTLDSKIPQKTVPSKKFIVRKVSKRGLYYNLAYNYDLEFVFVDEPEFEEEVSSKEGFNKENEPEYKDYLHELKQTKKKNLDWVIHNMTLSSPKKVKVLMIDHELRVLKESGAKNLDMYNFAIRPQTELSESLWSIDHNLPQVITIEAKNDDKGEEALEQAKCAIEKAKSIKDYTPFIVLFNYRAHSSSELQKLLNFKGAIAHSGNTKMSTIEGLAEIYEKKRQKDEDLKLAKVVETLKKQGVRKYQNKSAEELREHRYYIKKSHPLSHMAYSFKIQLTSVTESEVTFEAELELEPRSYRFTYPVPMSILLAPRESGELFEKKDGKKEYYGLIHSIDELDKKNLRVYINQVLFSRAHEKREKEQQEYWERHKEKVEEQNVATQGEENESDLTPEGDLEPETPGETPDGNQKS